MLFVDTNIFLEVEFRDAKWKECFDFLTKVAKGETNALTSDFVVYSSIIQIEVKTNSSTKIEGFIKSLLMYNGLEIFHPTGKELTDSSAFMKKYKLDFDDALVVVCMIANNIKTLVSFDSDFDKVKEIERIEPRDVR